MTKKQKIINTEDIQYLLPEKKLGTLREIMCSFFFSIIFIIKSIENHKKVSLDVRS